MADRTTNDLDAIARLPFSALSGPEAAEVIRDGLIAEIRCLRADRDRLTAGLRVVVDEINSTHAADPNSVEAPCYLVDYVRIVESLRDAAVGALTDVFWGIPDGTD